MTDRVVQLKDKQGNNIYPIATLNSFNDSTTYIPAGMICAYGGLDAPSGWLLCDGRAISRTAYPELFSIIGVTYGNGDGSTTFNVPNLCGRTLVGKGTVDSITFNLGGIGGEVNHKLTINEMPSHYHDRPGWYTVGTDGTAREVLSRWQLAGDDNGGTSSTGGGQSHNNMQPYGVVNYIINTRSKNFIYAQEDVRGMWCTAYGASSISLGTSTASGDLTFTLRDGSTDNQFKLSNGGVYCPYEGTISISAAVLTGTGFSQYDLVHLDLIKNNTGTIYDIVHRMPTTSYDTIQVSGFQKVSPGDTIKLRIFNQTAARGATSTGLRDAWLNVAYI